MRASTSNRLVIVRSRGMSHIASKAKLVGSVALTRLGRLGIDAPTRPSKVCRVPALTRMLRLVHAASVVVGVRLGGDVYFCPKVRRGVLGLMGRVGVRSRLVCSSFGRCDLLRLGRLSGRMRAKVLFDSK